MGLLDNLGGSVGNEAARVLGKSQESASRKSFNRDFNDDDFDEFGGDVKADSWVEIARFTVPAKTEYSWGYGSAENPENQGHLYVDLRGDDEDADGTMDPIEGTIRFLQRSATGRGSEVVADFDTTRLDASKSDKGLMVPFPEQVGHDLVVQDSHLTVELEANADDSIVAANSEVIIPVTEYDLTA